MKFMLIIHDFPFFHLKQMSLIKGLILILQLKNKIIYRKYMYTIWLHRYSEITRCYEFDIEYSKQLSQMHFIYFLHIGPSVTVFLYTAYSLHGKCISKYLV